MKNLMGSFCLQQDFLSNTELFYSDKISNTQIVLDGEEFHHCVNVMRHYLNDEIYVTNGYGKIYLTKILTLSKKQSVLEILKTLEYENKFQNIFLCLPNLKSSDRMEFAIEKCVELGITNFVIYKSDFSFNKGDKIFRWNKISVSAMKQSLRAWKPQFSLAKNLLELLKSEGDKIVFNQDANLIFNRQFLENNIFNDSKNKFLIIGPEGGFSSNELVQIRNELKAKLTGNRLRSETAVISVAILLNQFL
jgi:16S rRNA (uracil1498-N3)-methyltransferase